MSPLVVWTGGITKNVIAAVIPTTAATVVPDARRWRRRHVQASTAPPIASRARYSSSGRPRDHFSAWNSHDGPMRALTARRAPR